MDSIKCPGPKNTLCNNTDQAFGIRRTEELKNIVTCSHYFCGESVSIVNNTKVATHTVCSCIQYIL